MVKFIFIEEKPENNSLPRQKNTMKIIINHENTRMVKDVEDSHG